MNCSSVSFWPCGNAQIGKINKLHIGSIAINYMKIVLVLISAYVYVLMYVCMYIYAAPVFCERPKNLHKCIVNNVGRERERETLIIINIAKCLT